MKFPRLGVRKSSIEAHPQKQAIIDALLAGRPVREIAGWTVPPVGRMALQRYRLQHVLPALQHATTSTTRLAHSPVQKALRTQPEAGKAVEAARAEIQHGPILAIRQERLRLLQDRHDRLMSIVDARAANTTGVPGETSGLLDAEGKVDKALLSEFREHEKAAAIEAGQWNEGASAGIAIQIVMPVPPSGDHKPPPIVTIDLPKRRG